MKLKKLVAITLSAVMCMAALTGCGGKSDSAKKIQYREDCFLYQGRYPPAVDSAGQCRQNKKRHCVLWKQNLQRILRADGSWNCNRQKRSRHKVRKYLRMDISYERI